jgi:acyl transferase domain-containing protein
MEPARHLFAQVLAQHRFSRPDTLVFSNTLGGRYPEEPNEIAALLESHLVRPVRFADEVRAMYDQGARVFVERDWHGRSWKTRTRASSRSTPTVTA